MSFMRHQLFDARMAETFPGFPSGCPEWRVETSTEVKALPLLIQLTSLIHHLLSGT